MLAYAVRRFVCAATILDLPKPTPADGYVVRVTYAGVNPLDYKLVDNLTPRSSYPFVLGVDFAGVLEYAPPSERELRAGDRVFGIARTHGSYAQYTAVPPDGKAEALAPIPDSIADDRAAALPIAGITALGALDSTKVAAYQTFVVMGATGAVGGYAVQLARARGAHVIATVHRDTDEAIRLGAEEAYDSLNADEIDGIKRNHPDGVDAVLDVVHDADAIRRDAEILKPGGRLVSTLYAADVPWFATQGITSANIASVENPLASREGLTELAHYLATGAITARITTIEALANARALLDQLRHGDVRGKTVIRT